MEHTRLTLALALINASVAVAILDFVLGQVEDFSVLSEFCEFMDECQTNFGPIS